MLFTSSHLKYAVPIGYSCNCILRSYGARPASVIRGFAQRIKPGNFTEKKQWDGEKRLAPEFRRKGRLKFIDSLRLHVKGGAGGQGIPYKGGSGGRGGDIIVVGKKDITLKDFLRKHPTQRVVGEQGGNSRMFCMVGEPAKATVIEIPLGITILSEQGHAIGEVNTEDDRVVIARGGPGACEYNGFTVQKGDAHSVTLDLKLIADVGFVGFPNAGKSSLLRAISRANPRIAEYPFTTIQPNIGVIEYADLRRISLADLPGLIEGAHMNTGMGFSFLKHVERTKLLLFIVDTHGFRLGPKFPFRTAIETILLLNREIELYRPDLAEKPAILALNKTDLPGAFPMLLEIQDLYSCEEALQNKVNSMPPECRPRKIMRFDRIVGVSATKDWSSVNILKDVIRNVVDVNDEIRRQTSENDLDIKVKFLN